MRHEETRRAGPGGTSDISRWRKPPEDAKNRPSPGWGERRSVEPVAPKPLRGWRVLHLTPVADATGYIPSSLRDSRIPSPDALTECAGLAPLGLTEGQI